MVALYIKSMSDRKEILIRNMRRINLHENVLGKNFERECRGKGIGLYRDIRPEIALVS